MRLKSVFRAMTSHLPADSSRDSYRPTGNTEVGCDFRIRTDKRPAGQKIGDRITLFASALEAAYDGEEQTSPEDGP
jgi:hypothetical protein